MQTDLGRDGATMRWHRLRAAAFLVAMACVLVTGCRSVAGDEDRLYTVDDVAAAGWTKSRQLPTETLPAASEVWYGFYEGKDIELRVYASEEDATEHGIGPAEEAMERGERSFGDNRALLRLQYGQKEGKWTPGELSDMIPAMKTRYSAFLLARNLVMLCETDIAPCENLMDRVDSARQ